MTSLPQLRMFHGDAETAKSGEPANRFSHDRPVGDVISITAFLGRRGSLNRAGGSVPIAPLTRAAPAREPRLPPVRPSGRRAGRPERRPPRRHRPVHPRHRDPGRLPLRPLPRRMARDRVTGLRAAPVRKRSPRSSIGDTATAP